MKRVLHPAVEELLCHLDGETSTAEHARLEAHLQQCWKCRARAAELERQIHGVTKALQESAWPSADHQEIAHRRLHALLAREQASTGSPARPVKNISSQQRLKQLLPRIPSFLAIVRVPAISLAAIALLAAAYLALPGANSGSMLAQVPHSARTAHSLRFAAWDATQSARIPVSLPARGEMRVQLSRRFQPQPDRRRLEMRQNVAAQHIEPHATTVEWIADPSTGRFAIRWEERRGYIRFAAWQPRAVPVLRYWYRHQQWTSSEHSTQDTAFATVVPVLSEIGLEEEIFRWAAAFTSHHRSPMHRLAALAAQPGSRLRSLQDAQHLLTCVSVIQDGQQTEDCVRADGRTGDLLSETIAVTSSRHALRVEIPWNTVREAPEALAEFASFFPPGLESIDRDYASLRPARPHVLPPAQAAVDTTLLAALVAAEEVLEWLSVNTGPGVVLDLSLTNSAVRVSGGVASREQLALVRERFEQALPTALLQFDVLAADEVPLPPDFAQAASTAQSPSAPAAIALVERAFPQWTAKDLREYCNRTVRISGQLTAASVAMRQLAQRYPADAERLLTPEERRRLQNIRLARAARLKANAEVLRQHLAAIVPLESLAPAAAEPTPPSWQESALTDAAAARVLHERVLALFAIPNGDEPRPAASVEDLMAKLARLLHEADVSAGIASARNP